MNMSYYETILYFSNFDIFESVQRRDKSLNPFFTAYIICMILTNNCLGVVGNAHFIKSDKSSYSSKEWFNCEARCREIEHSVFQA